MIETSELRPAKSFWANIQSLYRHRELLFTLIVREIRVRYRQSVLGFGWAMVTPVIQMVVISVIFGNFLRVPSDGKPYPVFAYAAILPWSLFAGSITAAVPSIIANMNLVTKIYFPREVLPLAAIFARLVDFGIASVVFIGLMAAYQMPVYPTLLFLPVLLLLQILLAVGLGLLGSVVSVFLRDVSFAVPLGMLLWMYVTPVIYPLSTIPARWRSIYLLNPMAGIIDSYRKIILEGQMPNLQYLGISAVVSLVIFILAYQYFKRLEMSMADII